MCLVMAPVSRAEILALSSAVSLAILSNWFSTTMFFSFCDSSWYLTLDISMPESHHRQVRNPPDPSSRVKANPMMNRAPCILDFHSEIGPRAFLISLKSLLSSIRTMDCCSEDKCKLNCSLLSGMEVTLGGGGGTIYLVLCVRQSRIAVQSVGIFRHMPDNMFMRCISLGLATQDQQDTGQQKCRFQSFPNAS